LTANMRGRMWGMALTFMVYMRVRGKIGEFCWRDGVSGKMPEQSVKFAAGGMRPLSQMTNEPLIIIPAPALLPAIGFPGCNRLGGPPEVATIIAERSKVAEGTP
jgi:hypothetical protein